MRLAFLFGALFGALLAAAPAPGMERIALIIGNNYGLAEDAPLRFATEDAKSLHAALVELGGIEKERGYLLLNPGKAKVLATFQEILGRAKEIKRRGERAMIFAYYSGHGDPDAFHLGGESLSLDEVRGFFSQVDADLKVLVADACYSGALIRAKGAKLGEALPLDFTRETDARGSVILTSSSASELSRESRELQGSVFTHYFVSGLRGGADRDHDGRVSLQEAYEFARIQLARSPGGRAAAAADQNPQYDFDLRGSAPLILSEIDRGTARLRLDGLAPGEYSIFGERRRAVASVRLGLGDTVLFALPKAAYLVRRLAANKVYLAEADLNWSRLAALKPSDFASYPLDVLEAKGALPPGRAPWQAFAETEALESFPDGGAWMQAASLGLRYRWEDWDLGLSAGFALPHALSGPGGLQLRRRGYGLGAEGRYVLFERSRYMLFTGIAGRYWSLDQASIRAEEDAIRGAGYPAVPSRQGDAWSAAGSLGAELRLPLRLALSLQARPGLAVWETPDGSLGRAWRTSVGISAGYRF